MAAVAACVSDAPATGDGTDGGSGGGDGSSSDGTTGGGDGSSGGDSGSGTDSGPKNFCDTQSAPDGAADFFCADFDETDFAKGFLDASDNVTDGSTVGPTRLVYVSSPQSLLSDMAATSDFQSAYYEWRQAGATNIQQVAVSTSVNPTNLPTMISAPGFTYILGINEGHAGIDFGYAHGADLPDASDYRGFLVRVHAINGDLAFSNEFPAGDMSSDSWTRVTLTYDVTTGTVNVIYGTTLTASATHGYLIQTDTVADVLLGGRTFDTTNATTWRFDNFEVATTRAP